MGSKKAIVIAASVIVLLVILFFSFGFTSPPQEASRAQIAESQVNEIILENNEEQSEQQEIQESINSVPIVTSSTFEFEGYGPGKSHTGTFDEFEASVLITNNEISGFELTIEADSVNTGIGGLDSHLKNEDFFEVETYPQITFISSELDTNTGEITGELNFHGVQKEVTFPVEVKENSISTDFVLDTTPFNIKNTGVDKEVRIAFTFNI